MKKVLKFLGGVILAIILVPIVLVLVFGGSSEKSDTATTREATNRNVSVTFTSNPVGATVTVNGRNVGVTPISIDARKNSTVNYKIDAGRTDSGYRMYLDYSSTLQVGEEPTGVDVWLDRIDFEAQRQELMSSFLNHMSETLRDTSRESCSTAVRNSFPEAICYKTRSKSHNMFMQDWGTASGSFVATLTPYNQWERNRHNNSLIQRAYYFGDLIAPLAFVISYQEYALQYIVLPQK